MTQVLLLYPECLRFSGQSVFVRRLSPSNTFFTLSVGVDITIFLLAVVARAYAISKAKAVFPIATLAPKTNTSDRSMPSGKSSIAAYPVKIRCVLFGRIAAFKRNIMFFATCAFGNRYSIFL